MSEKHNSRPYDLEDRTQKFAKEVCEFVNVAPKTLVNLEILKQLVRSAGSVGANYIEANESISKKDYSFRVKICRKEAKESRYWLNLLQLEKDELKKVRETFVQEATELTRIFGAIIQKTKIEG
jgi:four helix bundle protein